MGALRPPNPPSAERRAANFWLMPRHSAPLFLTTDERYGFVKIPRGAPPNAVERIFGVWEHARILKIKARSSPSTNKRRKTVWHTPINRSAALGGGGMGACPHHKIISSDHRLLKKGAQSAVAYAKNSLRRARRWGFGGETPMIITDNHIQSGRAPKIPAPIRTSVAPKRIASK